jgi:hypothetical protein
MNYQHSGGNGKGPHRLLVMMVLIKKTKATPDKGTPVAKMWPMAPRYQVALNGKVFRKDTENMLANLFIEVCCPQQLYYTQLFGGQYESTQYVLMPLPFRSASTIYLATRATSEGFRTGAKSTNGFYPHMVLQQINTILRFYQYLKQLLRHSPALAT